MSLGVIEGKLQLKSRKLPWVTANRLLLGNVTGNTKWHKDWILENNDTQNIVTHTSYNYQTTRFQHAKKNMGDFKSPADWPRKVQSLDA